MRTRLAIAALGSLFLVGCASTTYYEVKDPSTGKSYYTTKYDQKDGATMLTDDKTRSEVTIQNSEIHKITKDQYMANVPNMK